MPTSGLTIRLTWGTSPSDLDSHLKGPNSTHVFFASPGSLAAQPFAALDVDDVTSFGPEVITVAQLLEGMSEYFVHNFSGTFTPGITDSPARVEMRFGSQIRIYFPTTSPAEGTNRLLARVSVHGRRRLFGVVRAGTAMVRHRTCQPVRYFVRRLLRRLKHCRRNRQWTIPDKYFLRGALHYKVSCSARLST